MSILAAGFAASRDLDCAVFVHRRNAPAKADASLRRRAARRHATTIDHGVRLSKRAHCLVGVAETKVVVGNCPYGRYR